MNKWIFRCYKNTRGDNDVIAWLNEKSKKAQQNLLRTLEHLSQKPKQEWSRPHASKVGSGHYIYVIRFKDETGAQLRLFGFFEKEFFVIALTGSEKDNVYKPTNYESTTISRRDECLRDWNKHTCNCLDANPVDGSLTINAVAYQTKI